MGLKKLDEIEIIALGIITHFAQLKVEHNLKARDEYALTNNCDHYAPFILGT